MKRKLFATIPFLLLFTFYFLLFTIPTFAQEGTTVSPAIIEENVDPGETLELIIKVTSGEENELYAFPVDFTAGAEETGTPKFTLPEEEATTYSLASWIKTPIEALIFSAGEKKRIAVKIEVPKNAEPGGHFGAVIFSSSSPKVEKLGVGVAGEVGALILFRVSGDIKEEGSLLEFKTDKSRFEASPVVFWTRVQNTGNVHFKPSGVIEIFNWSNQKEATLQVNPGFGNVLPQSIRKFETSWDPEQKVILKMGKYTAKLLLTLGTTGQTEAAYFSFWIIPIKFLAKVGAGFIIGIIIFALLIKQYNRWIIKKAKS